MVTRLLLSAFAIDAGLSATIANIISVLFAFITNDTIVFRQERKGWLYRLGKFVLARLATALIDIALAYLLVTRYPTLIGQFVNNDYHLVNLIEMLFSQVLIILLNYVFSKVFVFKNTAN